MDFSRFDVWMLLNDLFTGQIQPEAALAAVLFAAIGVAWVWCALNMMFPNKEKA